MYFFLTPTLIPYFDSFVKHKLLFLLVKRFRCLIRVGIGKKLSVGSFFTKKHNSWLTLRII